MASNRFKINNHVFTTLSWLQFVDILSFMNIKIIDMILPWRSIEVIMFTVGIPASPEHVSVGV